MPRHARLDIAGSPQLVLQQSPEDRPLFHGDNDYRYYLAELQAASIHHGCPVHAYALLPDCVYLLVTGPDRGVVSRMMQSLGRRFAHYANERDGSHGARWFGRYHSCPVGGKSHVLRACMFVELAPLRAGFALPAEAYPWSSSASNAMGSSNPCVTPHAAYLALAGQPRARPAYYRALLGEVSPQDHEEILMHIRQGRAWGSAGFLRRIATICGEVVRARPRGRPRKARSKVSKNFYTTLSPFLLTGGLGLAQTVALAF